MDCARQEKNGPVCPPAVSSGPQTQLLERVIHRALAMLLFVF
jgi:hypothetical protein